ncbi:MAG: response regulator transcription factor [Flavobacteriaceae bacterium]
MKIVIIEDEKLAAEKLERYLLKFDATIRITALLSSIKDAVEWFNSKEQVDIVFMDIQLTDGLSFEIFHQTDINAPVIFTTAFDEYAIDAFKVNSVDYILKPITFTDISNALKKYTSLKNIYSSGSTMKNVEKMIAKKKSKDRFLVKLGNHIHSIKTEEIALFFAEGRTVYLVTKENKKYILDFKLEDLSNVLDSAIFFRVNRTFILNIHAINDVIVFSNSRLKISTNFKSEKEIIVSREKVVTFKAWFEGS